MTTVLQVEGGGTIQVNACLHCGSDVQNSPICPDCASCPRCGGTWTQGQVSADPILLRCLNCLRGWTLEIRTVKGVFPGRPEEQLAFFAQEPAFDRQEGGVRD